MPKMKISLVLSAAILAACGGGGGGDVAYNYKQHDGSYSCTVEEIQQSLQAQTVTFAFTEKSVTFTSDGITQPVIFDDKVGFIQGKPYYSEQIPGNQTQAQTVYFNNNKLVVHLGLTVNVPDKLSEAPKSELTCSKL